MIRQVLLFFMALLLFTVYNQSILGQGNSINKENKLLIQSNKSKLNNYNQLFSQTKPDSVKLRIELAKKACAISKNSADCSEYIVSLINLGRAYNRQYRYDLAMEAYLEALKISDSIKTPKNRADIFHEIGSVYLDIRNLKLAHENFEKALKIKSNLKDKKSIAATNSSMALTYWLQGELDTALTYLFEALEIERGGKNPDGISKCYNNIGIVFHEKKEYQIALSYLQKALKINREQNDRWSIAEALNNIGENYISMGKYQKAKTNLLEAWKIAKELNALILLSDNYRYMARMCKETGSYKKALHFNELFMELEDSLYSQNKYSMISELKSSFEIEKKEQSIQLQKKKIELLKKEKKIDDLQKTILAGFIFFILSIGAIIYNHQKKINKRNKQLLEKDRLIKEAQTIIVNKEREEKSRLLIELEQKNKFLIDFGLYISMKNEFLLRLKNELKKLARQTGKNTELRQIVYQLNQNLRHNKELIDLQNNVEKVNYDFINKLLKLFPDITENEKQLSIFLRLNFSSKEIANIRAVSIKAVEMSRYRLRKKFNLITQDSLTQFLRNL